MNSMGPFFSANFVCRFLIGLIKLVEKYSLFFYSLQKFV